MVIKKKEIRTTIIIIRKINFINKIKKEKERNQILNDVILMLETLINIIVIFQV